MNERIYIIGGEGYIGSIFKYMFPKRNLMIVGRRSNLEKSVISIDDLKKIPSNSKCILLAALTDRDFCEKNKRLSYRTNVELVEKIYSLGFKKIVYASTSSVYESSDNFASEQSAVNSTSYYTETKLKAEEIILSNSNNVVARLAITIGVSPRMCWKLLANKLMSSAFKGEKIDIYGLNSFRPYYDVSEVAKGLFFLTSTDYFNNSIVNVGNTSNNFTKLDLLLEIKKIIPSFKWNTIEKNDEKSYRVSFSKFEKKFNHSLKFSDSFISLFQLLNGKNIFI